MQYAFNSKLSAFEQVTSDPALLKDFNTFMGSTMGARRYWVDWYPVKDRIIDGASPDKALLVDVGAGKGHDLLAFQEKFPNAGRLVLEDLAAVTETLDSLDLAIEKVPYDFYTEQPVIGKLLLQVLRIELYVALARSSAKPLFRCQSLLLSSYPP